MLHCAGSDIQDIAETNLTDTGTDFNTLVSKFSEYFLSRNNVVFERYEFRQCIQSEDVRIDSWHTRLRMKALSSAQSRSSDEEVFCMETLLSADNDARVVVSLNGATTRELVDSDASINVLPMSIYNQIKHPCSKPKPPSISVYPYVSKLPLDIAGVAAIEVQAFGHQRTLDLIVSMGQDVALLGRESASELDLLRVGSPPPPPNARSVNTVGRHSVNMNPPQRPGSTISNAASTQSPVAEHPLPEHLKTKKILSRYSKVLKGGIKNIQIAKILMKKNVILWSIPRLGSHSIFAKL